MSKIGDRGHPSEGVANEDGAPAPVNTPSELTKTLPSVAKFWSTVRTSSKFKPIMLTATIVLAVAIGGFTWGNIEAQKVEVPDLAGISVAAAQSLADDTDLILEATTELPQSHLLAFTTITSQAPTPGSRVFPGTSVSFTYELSSVDVPSLEGETMANARTVLRSRSLVADPLYARLPIIADGATGVGIHSSTDPASLVSIARALGIVGEIDITGGAFEIDGAANMDRWIIAAASSPAGTPLVAGSRVELTLVVPLTEVPSVTGMKYADAVARLDSAGITAGESPVAVYTGSPPAEFSFDIDELGRSYWSIDEETLMRARLGAPESWIVVKQSKAEGEITQVGPAVDLVVAWPNAVVPDIRRESAEDAGRALHDAGLSWHDVSGSATGVVQSQSPVPGTVLPMGARVAADVRNEVTFKVTSSAGSGMVTWAAPGSFSIEQANGARLPWSKTWLRGSVPGPYDRGNFNAQMNAWKGSITCSILVDGEVVVSNTSNGAFAVVSCS